MAKVSIEGFRDRVDAIVRTLVHEPAYFWRQGQRQIGNILEVNDIHDAMLGDPMVGKAKQSDADAGTRAGVRRRWEQALKEDKVPPEYLEFIRTLYPSVRGMLEAPLDEFRAFIAPQIAARREWERAMDHLANHRFDLAKLAKRYYADVDETQRPDFPYGDFPLVARRDWILDRPLLLTEASELEPPEYRTITAPKPPLLDGIDVPVLTLKESVTLRKRLAKIGRPYWNGLTYRVLDIERRGPGLHFRFGNSTYFEYINTCEARALELARADLRNGSEIGNESLPIRVSPSDVFSFLGRATFPGVNCLTILKNYEEPNTITDAAHDVYLVHYRDDTVLEAQNCVHVVPAGGHQPLSDDLGDPNSTQIWKTAAREFLEELRGYKELDEHDESKYGILEARPEFKTLFIPSPDGERIAKIFLLGVGIDPVTTKVEVLIAIVMDWRAARAQIDKLELIPNYEGKVKRIRFLPSIAERKEQLQKEAMGFIHAPWGASLPALPAGAACFQLAAAHYETLMELA